MPLLVGQLIYTNLPKTGFQLLASQHIPGEVKDSFVKDIVYQFWDAYNPPPLNYQAVFIHQVTAQKTLFGWLYNDGHDELGRAHIPYFLSYYLPGKLDQERLEHLWACLQAGPVYFLERARLSTELAAVILPEADQYRSPRPGFPLSSSLLSELIVQGQKHQLIQGHWIKPSPAIEPDSIPSVAFTPLETSETLETPSDSQSQALAVRTVSDEEEPLSPDFEAIADFFEEVVNEFIGIEGLLLISATGHPLTPAIGMGEETALILAGRMLKLAQTTQQELDWSNFERIATHSDQGHIVLSQCLPEIFLLMKTDAMLTGLLEVEMKRLIKKIQALYHHEDSSGSYTRLLTLPPEEEDNETFTDAMMLPEETLLYRGRRLSR